MKSKEQVEWKSPGNGISESGWHIQKNIKSIPDRSFDWDYWHDDYDYDSVEGGNGLCGNAASFAQAIDEIIQITQG